MPATTANDLLTIDSTSEVSRIADAIRETVILRFKRRGVVVGLSGGIDSSVVAALSVRALGPDRVFGLLMPESESAQESTALGMKLAESLGIRCETESITSILQAAGCYRRRDDAIRTVVPEYGDSYKSKIVLPNLSEDRGYSVFSLVVQAPDGTTWKVRLPLNAYLGIVAATNFKQRVRKMLEYYHADRLNFAVAGSPNRLEYDLGFFVKNGDGSADLKPIAHLYKSQVYQLASFLGIPEEIQQRPSTTDTYSLAQSQEEFYFSMPLATMDLCLYGRDHNLSPEELAPIVSLTPTQVTRAYSMIDSKRKATTYLVSPTIVLDPAASNER